MLKNLLKIIAVGVTSFSLFACDPRNLGSDDDVYAALIAANAGLSPDDFRRATASEIRTRFNKDWSASNPNIQFVETTIDGEFGRYIINRSSDRMDGETMESEIYFKVQGENTDGTMDITLMKGEVCLTSMNECSNINFGGGTAVMYLNSQYPDHIGLLTNYKTVGPKIMIKGRSDKEAYSGMSYWLFAGLLEAD